jgi:hypothetical protein
MASGHVNGINRPDTSLHRPAALRRDSPCQSGAVQAGCFDTPHVFFVIQHINRQVLHVAVTRHPIAKWLTQQILESCAWDRRPPRFMIPDRDSRYGPSLDRRLKRLGH